MSHDPYGHNCVYINATHSCCNTVRGNAYLTFHCVCIICYHFCKIKFCILTINVNFCASSTLPKLGVISRRQEGILLAHSDVCPPVSV